MSRVLVTGGVGAIGAAVVRRLLADPAYDVRVADRKAAPQWMREACEIRCGDLRDVEQAAAAVGGCRCVIHLAAPAAAHEGADYSLLASSIALDSTLLRAAIDYRVERFVYVSCASTFERADEPPTGETTDPRDRPPPRSAHGFAKLVGERLCGAAHSEHGLPVAICRPAAYPSAQLEDLAAEIVAALCSPAD